MAFLIKILFACIIFALVGGITYLSIQDVQIRKETITKQIPVKQAVK